MSIVLLTVLLLYFVNITTAVPRYLHTRTTDEHVQLTARSLPATTYLDVDFGLHQQFVQVEDDPPQPITGSMPCHESTSKQASLSETSTLLAADSTTRERARRDHAERRVFAREAFDDPFAAGLASGLAGALAPAFSAALAPVQSAANTNLAGVSLLRSEAPSVLPTADVIGPAQSAAAPVLSVLLADLVSAVQPLVSGAGHAVSAAVEPVASLANPLQSAILPPVESAVGPLVSALAPAVVAALAPAVAQLTSPLGPVESGLVGPLEGAVAPLLSDVVGEAVSALTGVEAPVTSLLQPVLSAVDGAVLPLVTSVVSAVWPAIGPAVTPLNPVICALQPAETPLGGDATELIPVQCVSITSGAIVPVSTGFATMFPSTTILTAAAGTTISSSSNETAQQPASGATSTSTSTSSGSGGTVTSGTLSVQSTTAAATTSASASTITTVSAATGGTVIVLTTTTLTTTISQPRDTLLSIFGSLSSQGLSSSSGQGGPSSLNLSSSPGSSAAPSFASATNVASVSLLPVGASPSGVSGSNVISVSEPPVMTCLAPAATWPAPVAAQPTSGVPSTPAANSQNGQLSTAAGAAPAGTGPAQPVNTAPPASSSTTGGAPLQVSALPVPTAFPSFPIPAAPFPASFSSPSSSFSSASCSSSSSSSSPPVASPAITAGPTTSTGQLILLSYGSQTVTFPAIMLPGGGLVASFMGSVFALPATAAAAQGLARRMEPIAVGSNFDFDAFAHELSSQLVDRLSPQQVIASSSKGGSQQQRKAQYAGSKSTSQQAAVVSEKAGGQGAGASLQISTCPDANGTTFVSEAGSDYSIVCNTNWVGRDIEYLAAHSFGQCVDACDALNAGSSYSPCAAALYVADAPAGAADCYLKSAIDNPSTNAVGYSFQAAVLTSRAGSPAKSFKYRLSQQPTIAFGYGSGPENVSLSRSTYTSGTTTIHFNSGINVATPLVSATLNIGVATTLPASQYYAAAATGAASSKPTAASQQKKQDGAPVGERINFSLAGTDMDPATGVYQADASERSTLENLTNIPHLSRDGGKGGMVNGQHIFMFADTAAYTTESDDTNGHYINWASSSVATDVGMRALYGHSLAIGDPIGEFGSAQGALRGFIPLTSGETGFNAMAAKSGANARYSIWPESSLIALNSTSSIAYAPIVFSHSDAEGGAQFTYAGNTLVTIRADDAESGPSASRTVGRLFNSTSVEWGNIGGIRSWGSSGVGGNDGRVYLFGNARGGLLLARAEATAIDDIDAYQFWNGARWTSEPVNDESNAHVLPGAFMDADIFYSPRHLTFIAVYTNIYADSTFYWRYLKAPQALRPSYAGGDVYEDITEALTRYRWSDEKVLFRAGKGLNGGYAYAGGVHLGYFGEHDIANGGDKMLLTWTSPTGQDPASRNSAYQLGSGIVKWA